MNLYKVNVCSYDPFYVSAESVDAAHDKIIEHINNGSGVRKVHRNDIAVTKLVATDGVPNKNDLIEKIHKFIP